MSRRFKTYHKLQGSQTLADIAAVTDKFKTYHKLQGSQTYRSAVKLRHRLRHIINYKVLKHQDLH